MTVSTNQIQLFCRLCSKTNQLQRKIQWNGQLMHVNDCFTCKQQYQIQLFCGLCSKMNQLQRKIQWNGQLMHVKNCFTCNQQHLRLTVNDLLYNLCAKYVLARQNHVKTIVFCCLLYNMLQNIVMLCVFVKLNMFLYEFQSNELNGYIKS